MIRSKDVLSAAHIFAICIILVLSLDYYVSYRIFGEGRYCHFQYLEQARLAIISLEKA